MTEDNARQWIAARFGGDAIDRLQQLADLVRVEAERQNLIARSTLDRLWSRHIVDSAQLVLLASPEGLWLDIGTGAGFPGLVVAILRAAPIVLAEPRQRRATFLAETVQALRLPHVNVEVRRVELLDCTAAVISARAVAPVEKLLHAAAGCATLATRWLLPRGQSGLFELRELRPRWDGMFHVEQSITDLGSTIIVADGVSPR